MSERECENCKWFDNSRGFRYIEEETSSCKEPTKQTNTQYIECNGRMGAHTYYDYSYHMWERKRPAGSLLKTLI